MDNLVLWALAVVLLAVVVVVAMRYTRARSADQSLQTHTPVAGGVDRATPNEPTTATASPLARHEPAHAPAAAAPPVAVSTDGDSADDRSLYARLGGTAAITLVVEDFYRRVLADDSLRPVFEGVDMDQLRKHQVLFLAFALGGPNQYTGRRVAKAHEGLGITEAQFGAVAGHLSASLAAHHVPPPLIDEVIGRVAKLQPEVVQR